MPQPPVDHPHGAVGEEARRGVRDDRAGDALDSDRDDDAPAFQEGLRRTPEVAAQHRMELASPVGELAAVDVDVTQDVVQDPLGHGRDGGGGIRSVLDELGAQDVELGGECRFHQALGRVGVLVERRPVDARRIGELGHREARDRPLCGEFERGGVQAVTAASLAGIHTTSGNLFDRCRLTPVYPTDVG